MTDTRTSRRSALRILLLEQVAGDPTPLGDVAPGAGAANASIFNAYQVLKDGGMISGTTPPLSRTVELAGTLVCANQSDPPVLRMRLSAPRRAGAGVV